MTPGQSNGTTMESSLWNMRMNRQKTQSGLNSFSLAHHSGHHWVNVQLWLRSTPLPKIVVMPWFINKPTNQSDLTNETVPSPVSSMVMWKWLTAGWSKTRCFVWFGEHHKRALGPKHSANQQANLRAALLADICYVTTWSSPSTCPEFERLSPAVRKRI